MAVLKEFALPPLQVTPTATVSVPLPIWDQNKGNIVAAEAALVRAAEEPHRVETNLVNNFAAAYTSYKNNVDALEYYRKFILPDQVRAIAASSTAAGSTPALPSATWCRPSKPLQATSPRT